MPDVALREPYSVIAGDTVKWRREDLANYPASSGWALSYAFRNAAGKIDVTATADGAAFAVSVPATTTQGWKPGTYTWSARVENAGEVYTVGGGTLVVLPNLSQMAVKDARVHAERMLEAIEATLEGRATADVLSYRIGDRELQRMPPADLVVWRDKYRAEVNALRAAEQLARGERIAPALFVRF